MVFQRKWRVLGVNISASSYSHILKQIFTPSKKCIFAPIATHPVMLCQKNKPLLGVYNSIDFLLPDSQYLRLALFFLYGIKMKDRIYGPELLKRVCFLCVKNNTPLFLCGNDIAKVESTLKIQYPYVRIAGVFDLRSKRIDTSCSGKIDQLAAKSGAQIIVIGIGSPAQHVLATTLQSKVSIVCVGAAFDFLTKKQRQSPYFLGKIGMEWLYRFIQSPSKMWHRYLVLAPLFLIEVFKQKISNEK